jgi:tetratricopeptide (TPR) repeat protein
LNKAAEALLRAGHQLEEKGRNDEALSCYDEAARADPECADAWYDKARMLINIHGLMGSQPQNLEAYVEAHKYLLKAGECGHKHASTLDEVLLPFFQIAVKRLR